MTRTGPSFTGQESESLCALAPFILAIEHFGSTAVPAMASKPIVDILVGVKDLPIATDEIQKFEQAGHKYLGEAGVRYRLYFRKRGVRNFNLAVVVSDGRHWKDNLLLRDYLRSDRAAVEYEKEKHRSIAEGATMLLAYSRAKGDCLSPAACPGPRLADFHCGCNLSSHPWYPPLYKPSSGKLH